MTFNSKLNFEPDLERFKNLERPTHILLSGYLRHSKTFELYSILFQQLEMDMRLHPFELETFSDNREEDIIRDLLAELKRNELFLSMMVSDPYKQRLLGYVDELDPRASRCNALNMISKIDGKLVGNNLDGLAFQTGIKETTDIDFEDKSMCFFGCGGVSSAVALELASSLSHIGLVDVSEQKVEELMSALKKVKSSSDIEVIPACGARDFTRFEYLYNGTGLGKTNVEPELLKLSPLNPNDLLAKAGIAFDANYSPAKTQFLLTCQSRGLRIMNGLNHMLASTSLHISSTCGAKVEFCLIQDAFTRVLHG